MTNTRNTMYIYYLISPGVLLLSKAERLADAMLNQYARWKKLTGASHGFSGLILMLHRLYMRTSREKYLNFLIELVQLEDKFYSPE